MTNKPTSDGDKKVNSRRGFLRKSLITAGATAGFLASVKFDAKDGVKIGNSTVGVGMSEAQAACGSSYNCSGGGGQCGSSYDCGGGGGQCGSSYNCSGGGGQCGASYNCAGT